MDYDSLIYEEQPFVFDVDPAALVVEGTELPEEARTELLEKLKKTVVAYKAEVQGAGKHIVAEFPVDTLAPFVVLFYAVQVAEKVEFTDKYLEMGFSLEHLRMILPRHAKLLKSISGEFFKEVNHAGDEALFQFNIDDNAFNSITSVIVSVDKMFSAREILKGNPKAEPFMDMLTTTTIGTVLP